MSRRGGPEPGTSCPHGAETLRQVPGLLTVSGLTFSPTRTDASINKLNISSGLTNFIYEIALIAGSPAGTFQFPAQTLPTPIARVSAPKPNPIPAITQCRDVPVAAAALS